jgi:hypothetical protein
MSETTHETVYELERVASNPVVVRLALVEAVDTVRDMSDTSEVQPHEVTLDDVRRKAEAHEREKRTRGDEVVDDIVEDEYDTQEVETSEEPEHEDVSEDVGVDVNDVLRTLRESPDVRDLVLDATQYGEVGEFAYDEDNERVILALDMNDE